MIKNTTIAVLGIACILLFIFRPTNTITDNSKIEELTKTILEDKLLLMEKDELLQSLNDSLKRTKHQDSITISKLKYKPVKELEAIKDSYIERGTDSTELLQTVTKFQELDFCKDQNKLLTEIVNVQKITINDLNDLMSVYDERSEEIELRDKECRKKVIKARIVTGVTIAGAVLIIIFALSGS